MYASRIITITTYSYDHSHHLCPFVHALALNFDLWEYKLIVKEKHYIIRQKHVATLTTETLKEGIWYVLVCNADTCFAAGCTWCWTKNLCVSWIALQEVYCFMYELHHFPKSTCKCFFQCHELLTTCPAFPRIPLTWWSGSALHPFSLRLGCPLIYMVLHIRIDDSENLPN